MYSITPWPDPLFESLEEARKETVTPTPPVAEPVQEAALRATPVIFIPGLVTDLEELRRPCTKVKNKREGFQIINELWAMLERNNKRAYGRGNMERFRASQKVGMDLGPVILPGIGLSAIQIGICKKVCVLNLETEKLALINPVITQWSTTKIEQEEGCLSMPGVTGFTHRYAWVAVTADNWPNERFFGGSLFELPKDGKGQPMVGPHSDMLTSTCLQHEIAHCYSKVITDFENEEYPDPTEWETWQPETKREAA